MTTPLRRLGPLLACLAAAAVSAEPIPLAVEVAAFPEALGRATLEIYAGTWVSDRAEEPIPGPRLHRIEVIGEDGARVGEASRVVPVASPGVEPPEVWRFTVSPGEFRIRLLVQDLETGDEGTFGGRFRVPRFDDEGFAVSTPVFGVLSRGGGPGTGGIDTRGGLRPVAFRRIPGEEDTLGVYLVVSDIPRRSVPATPGDPVALGDTSRVVEIQATLRRGSTLVKEDSTRLMLNPAAEYLRVEPSAHLTGGKYRLELRVRRGGAVVVREVEFTVPTRGRDLLLDPGLIRTVLSYVATGEERLALESAPDDSLDGLWTWFWTRRDPSGGTVQNEARELFVTRVAEAGRRFGGVVPGWRTDRGRILIRHGEPTWIERVPASTTGPATETWYYRDGRPRYVFEDQEGFGDYHLTGGYRD